MSKEEFCRQNVTLRKEVRDLLVRMSDTDGVTLSRVVADAIVALAASRDIEFDPVLEVRNGLRVAQRGVDRMDPSGS